MNNWFNKLVKKYNDKFDLKDELSRLGVVRDLKVKDNVVSAVVTFEDGNKFCEIIFKKFSFSEKNKLCDVIKNPINYFRLNKGILPEELFDCGVKIYPDSLDDFVINCSCDSEFDFCRETVQVLQVLNGKMIKDPFFIFSLRGIDFKKLNKFPIQSINEIFKQDFKGELSIFPANFRHVNSIFLKCETQGDGLDAIYSEIFRELNNEAIVLSLVERREYLKFKQFKCSNYYQDGILDLFKEKWDVPNNISFDIDSNYKLASLGHIKHPRALFAYLMEMNQFDSFNFDYNLCFMLNLLELTFSLIEDYAIVPQIFSLDNGEAKVRWIPACYDGSIVFDLEEYYHDCPSRLITYNGRKISKENQVIIAVSLIMQGYIDFYRYKYGVHIFKKNLPDMLFKIFFDESFDFKSANRKIIVSNVAEMLSIFEMNTLKFQYALILNNDTNGMFLELKIKRNGKYINLEDASFKELIHAKNIYGLFSKFQIKNSLYERIYLNSEDYLVFKNNIKPLLKYINTKYEIAIEIREVTLKLKLDLNIEGDSFTFNSLNNYEWKVIIGDDVISLDEFNKISKDLEAMANVNGNFYSVDRAKLSSFQTDILFLPQNLESNELLQLSLLERYRNIKFEGDTKLKEFLNISDIIDNPIDFNGDLRHYQCIGVSWLLQNIKSGFGSILADDMGLGKTVQILACILHLKQNNQLNNQHVLIIVPTTLISNWQQEIEKFAPTLTYCIYHGGDRVLSGDTDIVLTSFGMIRKDISKFKSKFWFACIVDEAQNIKNPKTQQTKAVKSIKAFNKIALTGTPIENRLLDYWSIFDFTNHGYLFSQSKFKKDFVSHIEKSSSDRTLKNLKKITKPFILRRLKTDKEIINDLPEKHVNDIYCSLTTKQAKLYDKTMEDIFKEIKTLKGIDRRGLILKLITHLKQICNHPAQYLKSDNPKVTESGKLELLIEILGNILDVDEKVIIFTQYVEMGEILQNLVLKKFNREVLFLHGSLSRSAREKILNSFQNDSHFPILIATLKTGGVGLNLTAAQNVIHYDLWWNPAVENQATDRVYRIGQKKDVMVYRFITKGTLEENIDLMIKDKLKLAGKAIDGEETFITEMTDEELLELLSLR